LLLSGLSTDLPGLAPGFLSLHVLSFSDGTLLAASAAAYFTVMKREMLRAIYFQLHKMRNSPVGSFGLPRQRPLMLQPPPLLKLIFKFTNLFGISAENHTLPSTVKLLHSSLHSK
jgi:hypothetical protein